ncbi:UPF0149 family protein [Marinobacter salicampi]|uniref:UPF0149 family protein n=1 Tax=Marinobacter salicampi TaxID=435907 RepID=UPI00140D206B|nr:UPF0149 family protein [Marinobacter salicampi]
MTPTDLSEASDIGAFEHWANVYTMHKAFSHPSELHGALCGRLAAGARMDENSWLQTVCEQMGIPASAPEESPELKEFMIAAYDRALEELKTSDMSFQPLLPEDDYSLDHRVQALSAWVRGFLEGMTVGASSPLGEAPEEIRELIEDLVAISQVSETEEDSEDGEYQLTEIVEYVRLGALAVFTEFNPPETAGTQAGKSGTVH